MIEVETGEERMREEEAAVQLQLCVFFIVAEVRDKLCSFSPQYETRNIFSEYGTISFFKGRLTTLLTNLMNTIKFTISHIIAPTQLYRNSVMLASTQYELL